MIILHGLLGSKNNWETILKSEEILASRDCYVVELRNHAESDHHDDFSYEVLSEDVIRLADKLGIDSFTILGHSLGGRTAMTLAGKVPHRVDAVISIDIAPVDETNSDKKLFEFTQGVIDFMWQLQQEEGLTRMKAVERAMKHYQAYPEYAFLIRNNMKRVADKVEWLANIEAIHRNFHEIPFFDETLRYHGANVLQLYGEKSLHYGVDTYKKVFPNIDEQNIIMVEGAGHWIHMEKPMETIS